MKHPASQFIVSLVATGTLLGAVASNATDLADKPLKASVWARPNVIFGLDDSGSMDSEVLLPNNDGALWWNTTQGSSFDRTTGKTWFNDAGGAGVEWKKMVYLFPNGKATGSRVYEDDDNGAHYAIPPTAELAFTRSPDFNPIYFNPKVTYRPWGPAWVSGADYLGPDATPASAKSHPIYGTGTFDVTTDRVDTAVDWTFTAFNGARLPGTAKVCNSAVAPCTAAEMTRVDATPGWAETTAGSGIYTNATVSAPVAPVAGVWAGHRVSMSYFPATYYLTEVCTVDGTTCVHAPDGTTTLKRYEIKPANYATVDEYNAAIKNFANWFTYYRKRKLMLNAAMGEVLEPLTGLWMGIVHLNNRPALTTRVKMYDSDDTSSSKNARAVAGVLYQTDRSGGTPTRETLSRIGQEYAHADGPIKFACQRNNAFILTDGFANASNVPPPAPFAGYSKATYGLGAPYETTHDKTLANLALAFYTVNPRPGLAAGKVPTTATDSNPDLHINTYGLTIGSKGIYFQDETSPPPVAPADWINPTAARHPSSVDDLWHATINGRGKMYLATTPTETAVKIKNALDDIKDKGGAQGGIAVSTVNLTAGVDARAYFGVYNPSGWTGDLTGNEINPTTGAITKAPTWSASDKLLAKTWSTRKIASWNGANGVGFTSGEVGSIVNPAGNTFGDTDEVINYLRGDRSLEGSTFRPRKSLIGAVINSEPVVSRSEGVVYVQSGEGMLHAFDIRDPDAGEELWAFVPGSVLPHIGESTARRYVFGTLLDGPLTLGKFGSSSSMLVAGTGVSGRSYHAIDVTNPRFTSEAALASKVLWTFPDAANAAKVGQTTGRPVFVRLAGGKTGVLLTSGYNNDDGVGRMWLLELNATGGIASTHEFNTGAGGAGTDAGLAQVSSFVESDGTVKYVYGGDLLGNVWRFDLDAKTAPFKLASLVNGSATAQPVTAPPELVYYKGKRIVLIGTGRMLGLTDLGDTATQSFYAISDGAAITNVRTALVQQTYNRTTGTISSNAVDFATDRGWFMDLSTPGEQANTRPVIAYGAIVFVTNVNGGASCAASSYLYVLDALTGGKYLDAPLVSKEVSPTAISSAATAIRTPGGPGGGGDVVAVGQDGDANPWAEKIISPTPIPAAKNAWREIRR